MDHRSRRTVRRQHWTGLCGCILLASIAIPTGVNCRANPPDIAREPVVEDGGVENACGDPPVVKHTSHNGTGGDQYTNGTILRYMCDHGYAREGYPLAYCRTGKWKTWPLECSVKSCGYPGDVFNGRREGLLYSVASQVEFICNPGYEAKGSRFRTCLANAKWTGSVPTCVPIKCPQLRSPANGELLSYAGTYEGKAKFSCYAGYKLHGTKERTCQADKTWSGAPVECREIDCGRPVIANGTVVGESTVYGSVIIFKCDKGALLTPKNTLTSDCLVTAEWAPPIPECRFACDMPPKIDNGDLKKKKKRWDSWANEWAYRLVSFISTEVPDGRSLEVYCNRGYHVSDQSLATVTCVDGQLSELPSCEEDPCKNTQRSSLYRLSNGKIKPTKIYNSSHSEEVRYECDPGYTLEGNPLMTCKRGRWIRPYRNPRCKENFCPIPRLNDSMTYSATNRQSYRRFKHRATVSVKCAFGYYTLSRVTHVWKCYNATWRKDGKFNCLPEPCSMIHLPKLHGTVKYSSFTHGSSNVTNGTVTISCFENYREKSNVERATCRLGKWDPSKPNCEEIPCDRPQSPQNGSVQQYDMDLEMSLDDSLPEEISHGQSVATVCHPGYKTTRTTASTCYYGRWVPDIGTCIPNPCHRINSTNGEISYDREYTDVNQTYVAHKSRATIECRIKRHRIKNGVTEATCELGQWKPQIPECEEIPCGRPEDIPDGLIHMYDEEIRLQINGSLPEEIPNKKSVIVVCNHGYSASSNESTMCRYGRWSSDLGRCDPDPCHSYYREALDELESDDLGDLSVSHGTVKKIVCAEGHYVGEFNGRAQTQKRTLHVSCQLGEWNHTEPFCYPNPCQWPRIKNALCNGTLCVNNTSRQFFRSGGHVAVKCIEGYNLDGSADVTCRNGKHQTTLPVCSLASCADLYNISHHGMVNLTVIHGDQTDHTLHGTEVEITCAVNFTSFRANCSLGNWEPNDPMCREAGFECGPAPVVPNGQHEEDDKVQYEHGQVLWYSCRDGFTETSGDRNYADCEKGLWSEPDLICTAVKTKYCDGSDAPSVEHARHDSLRTEPLPVGSTLTYKCDSGFVSTPGSVNISICQGNEVWSMPNLVCAVLSCNKPPSVHNARHDLWGTESFPAATTLTYECYSGFLPALDSESSITCQHNGSWSALKLICSKSCPKPEVSDSKVTVLTSSRSEFRFRETVRVKCNLDDYYMEGSGQLTCGQFGRWEGQTRCVTSIPDCLPGQSDHQRFIGKIYGHNDRTSAANSFQICLNLCQKDKNCISADFDPNGDKCHMSKTSKRKHGLIPDMVVIHIDMLCKKSGTTTVKESFHSSPFNSYRCPVQPEQQDVIVTYIQEQKVIEQADSMPEGTNMLSRCKEFGTYVMEKGDSRRRCHQGKWNGTQPSCSKIDIVSMPAVKHITTTAGSKNVKISPEGHLVILRGSVVHLSCEMNYRDGLSWEWDTQRKGTRSTYRITAQYQPFPQSQQTTWAVDITFTAELSDTGVFTCKCANTNARKTEIYVEVK